MKNVFCIIIVLIILSNCLSCCWAVSEAKGSIAEPLKGLVGFTEDNSGAFYYVRGITSKEYTKAGMLVDLSNTQLNTANSKRVAYISFTVAGVDMGLRNDGNGWSTYYVDFKNPRRAKWSGNELLNNVSKVEMYVRALKENGKDKIRGYFVFFDKTGNKIKSVTVEAIENSGVIFTDTVRITRFISFIPNFLETDTPDGTYLRNVKIINTKLINPINGKSVSWAINSSFVPQAWVVQPWNIKITKTSTGENCTISHEFVYKMSTPTKPSGYLSTKTIPLSIAVISGDVKLADSLKNKGYKVDWESSTGNVMINGQRLTCANAPGASMNNGSVYVPQKVFIEILNNYR